MNDAGWSHEPKRIHRWVVVLMLVIIVLGLVLFAIGMVLEQRDRLAVPGLCVSLAAAAAGAVYGLLRMEGTFVVVSYRHSERAWRHKDEVPMRYWLSVVLWSVCSIVLVVFGASLMLAVVSLPAPPDNLSASTELGLLLFVLSPAALSCFCAVAALRNLRPDTDYRLGKLLLPRHVTDVGRGWLYACYLLSLLFVVFVCLASAFAA